MKDASEDVGAFATLGNRSIVNVGGASLLQDLDYRNYAKDVAEVELE